MILHNAIPPFDGDEIVITDPKSIKDFTIDHSLATGDCTRVVLDDGQQLLVQETVEEISAMLGAEGAA